MYLRILKKDLKRKKTMNAILLLFIILATMFIASGANNMITVATALDNYFEMANVPDYYFITAHEEETERFDSFAGDHGYDYSSNELIQLDPKNVTVDEEKLKYSNTVCISAIGGEKIFDSNEKEITHVADGEIYISAQLFNSKDNHFYEGCKITLESDDVKKEFTLKGYTKDALFGSSMIGMTRFLISQNDFALFDTENANASYSISVYTDDTTYMEKFTDLNLLTTMNINYSGIKLMYLMDMLIAATVLIVSICLILISMVILKFTINFTMSEEFREIGVMKAIGIANHKIRKLYIVKYLAISVFGGVIGYILSFPFGKLLLESVSKNIIISQRNTSVLNLIFAGATAVVVIMFCYFCTRKINHFSPIVAIRNGQSGERYERKSFLRLHQSGIAPIPFMAANDICSGLKRYASMIVIFTLGLLLILIPVNAINTLQSDKLIAVCNMAECNHVISQELFFSPGTKNRDTINDDLNAVKDMLRENDIEADVFRELLFRFRISHGDKHISSLAFQGAGGVTTDMYPYLEGSAPQNNGEVAITYIVADTIGAHIGDDVEIDIGSESRTYTVTAIYQSMNNLGEGIRFYQEDALDYNYLTGNFGMQIKYTDNPDSRTLADRKKLLEATYPDVDIFSSEEYINYMIGDVAGELQGVKHLILGIVLCINILVTVLMVKSFLTKEKGEIAMLKSMGFQNSSLIMWQSMRIGIVLLIAIVVGTLLSTPLTKLTVEPVFRMMGSYSIEFQIEPLEIYVIYPLILLFIAVLAGMITAAGLTKISVSETANIE